MKKITLLICMAIFVAVSFSCKKEPAKEEVQNVDEIVEAEQGTPAKYIYILNEGTWGNNEASLDRIEIATGTYEHNVFGAQNGRDLGDIANDIQLYGSKMYIVVNNSNTLEVVDPESGRSIQQISEGLNQPRYLVGAGAYVYVSSYSDLVYKIDTATFSVVAICNVGRDPEMMAVVGEKLYVVNSGGLDNPNYDTTVSVVDLTTFQEVEKFAVGTNPTKLVKIDENRLLAVCNGNYGNVPSSLRLVDLSTENVTEIASPCTNLILANGFVYCYDFDWFTYQAVFYRINLTTFAKEDFVLSGSDDIVSPYGIAINKGNGNIYVTDSRNFLSNGDIYCFSAAGALRYKHETGVGPSKVVMW
ncbi:MAG: YncE family protein [Bacteroidales bacterium]|nr:YncE family protein [Bacteroidales bacterium]